MDKVYKEITSAKRIVVKVGTSTLTHSTGRLNLRRIEKMVKVLADLKNQGKEIVLVTSGAIGIGMGLLGMTSRPRDIRSKQAAAAVGQCELMNIYSDLFSEYGHVVAQILLTKDIIEDAKRKENAINTFSRLLDFGVIPIVNENDCISTEEIEFGDNDTLSAMVATLTGAKLLVLLTDIDGMYDDDPRTNKSAKRIDIVENVTDELLSKAGGAGSGLGTGGMITKLYAAQKAAQAGIYTVIADGQYPVLLYDLVEGKSVGTLFLKNRKD